MFKVCTWGCNFAALFIALFIAVVTSVSGFAQSPDQACPGLPKPALMSPGDGSTEVSLTPILELTILDPLAPSCVWDQTNWYLLVPGSSQFTFWEFSFQDLMSIAVPPGLLQEGTQYCWYATIISTSSGAGGSLISSSADGRNCFTTRGSGIVSPNPPSGQVCADMPAPRLNSPRDGDVNVPLEASLDYEVPLGVTITEPCIWSNTEIVITTDTNPANPVYNTLTSAGNKTFTVQSGILQPDTAYCWYVIITSIGTGQGGNDVKSNVPTENCFRTEAAGGLIPPVGPVPVPPPPNPGAPPNLASYDANGNCELDDLEFFQMLDDWIGQRIDDPFFFLGVDAWIDGRNICVSAAARAIIPIQLEIKQRQNLLSVAALATTPALIELELYSLQGSRMHAQRIAGSRLTLNLSQLNLANGVYLYQVNTYDRDGKIHSSQIKKLIVLR